MGFRRLCEASPLTWLFKLCSHQLIWSRHLRKLWLVYIVPSISWFLLHWTDYGRKEVSAFLGCTDKTEPDIVLSTGKLRISKINGNMLNLQHKRESWYGKCKFHVSTFWELYSLGEDDRTTVTWDTKNREKNRTLPVSEKGELPGKMTIFGGFSQNDPLKSWNFCVRVIRSFLTDQSGTSHVISEFEFCAKNVQAVTLWLQITIFLAKNGEEINLLTGFQKFRW